MKGCWYIEDRSGRSNPVSIYWGECVLLRAPPCQGAVADRRPASRIDRLITLRQEWAGRSRCWSDRLCWQARSYATANDKQA